MTGQDNSYRALAAKSILNSKGVLRNKFYDNLYINVLSSQDFFLKKIQ